VFDSFKKIDWHPFIPKSVVCWREGYGRDFFVRDLFAGLAVAFIALPLAMAFAIASGVTPERGLYTAIVAGFLISALGGSRVQVGGPTGAFVVIIYGIVQRHGYDGLVVATVIAGLILLLMGFAKLGNLIKFVPYPVTTGFTSGIAVIIFTSQIKDFFGLNVTKVPAEFFPKLQVFFQNYHTVNFYAVMIAVLALAILLILRRVAPRIPAAIVAVVVTSILVWVFDLPVETIATKFGGIPSRLPKPVFLFPQITFSQLGPLISDAITIAFLAAIESLLSAVVADGMTGYRHKSNCELVAQGFANIASVVFGGIPATGAIARTAANVKTGAKTPLSGMLHAVFLLLFMVIFAPWAKMIPLATLASILILVAWNMSEKDHFIAMFKSPKSDWSVMLTTFLLTVAFDLTLAVNVGIIFSAILFMKRMSDVTSVRVGSHATDPDSDEFYEQHNDPDAIVKKSVPAHVDVFEIVGPLFFGVVDKLKDALSDLEEKPKVFILRMRFVPSIDASGLHAIKEFHHKCQRQGIQLVVSGVNPQPLLALKNSGLYKLIGSENIYDHIDKALARARELTS
jgi:SulP family sulfate permease